MAAAGSAIGLGNLWKFPYITWDNRLPIMIAEILIGRKTQQSPVGALRAVAGPAWGWVGGLGVVSGFVILSYYTVIAGWTLRYFWSCLGWSLRGFDASAASAEAFGLFSGNGPLQVALAGSFMLITVLVVHRGVSGGIERVARVLMPALLGILMVLLVAALSLEKAGQALKFIFVPDALGHAFFTLSLGMGAMITYGSYLSRRESVIRASAVVVALDTVIALTATVIMFSVIFSFQMSESVSASTAGMLFITLPTLFYQKVPFGNVLAPMFYVLVGFAALTSTISLLEVIASYFIDRRGWTRTRAAWTCGITTFGVSVLCALSFGAWPTVSSFSWVHGKEGLFDHLDYLASNWLLPVGGFFITFAAGWLMTRQATEEELVDASTPSWFRYGAWRFVIRYLAPLAVAAIIAAVISGKDFS